MGIADEANDRLLMLWEEFPRAKGAPRDRWPLLYGHLQPGGVLFVGLNPGFNETWLQEKVGTPEEFFRWNGDGSDETKRERIREIGAESRREYRRYFGPLEDIADAVDRKDHWEHVDLFAVREGNQSSLRELLKLDSKEDLREVASSDGKGNPFARKQLDITEDLIRKLDPEVVIVVNALASRILRIRWNVPRVWNEDPTFKEKGYHEIPLNGHQVPVLFSGMVGGRQPLDTGSRERLTRQIWKALAGRQTDR